MVPDAAGGSKRLHPTFLYHHRTTTSTLLSMTTKYGMTTHYCDQVLLPFTMSAYGRSTTEGRHAFYPQGGSRQVCRVRLPGDRAIWPWQEASQGRAKPR